MRLKPSRPLVVGAAMSAILCGAATAPAVAAPLPAAKNPKTTTVKVAGKPLVGVSAAGKLWVLADRAGELRLLELRPGNGRGTGRFLSLGMIQPGTPRYGSGANNVRPSITAAGGYLWAIDAATHEILRIDPVALAVTARIPVRAHYLAVGPAGLWAAANPVPVDPTRPSLGQHRPLLRIDPATATIVQRINLGPGVEETRELAVGRDVVWIARSAYARNLFAVSPADGNATPLGRGGWQMYGRGGTLYSTDRYTCSVEVRAPADALGGAFQVPRRSYCPWRVPRDVAQGPARSVWIAQYRPREAQGRLIQGSLSGKGPTRIFKVGRDPVDVVPGRNVVWVLNDADKTLTRVPAKALPKR